MQTINRLAFLVSMICSTTLGCDAQGDEIDAVEFRDDSGYVAPWSSVKCLLGNASRCYAASPSGGDTVQPVVSWCDLHAKTWSGELMPTTDGWWYDCDIEGRPESFEDVICFYDTFTHVVCYGGSDGWYTAVTPSCVPNSFTAAAWPTGTCDSDSSPGAHTFGKIKTVPQGKPYWGLATEAGDSFNTVPSCMSAAGDPAADPYSCQLGTQYPCCTCDAGNAVVCVAVDEFGQCPAGTTTEHMTECA